MKLNATVPATLIEAWADYNEAVQKPCAEKRQEAQAKEVECAFVGGVFYALNILSTTLVDEGAEAMGEKMIALRNEVYEKYGKLKKENECNPEHHAG